MFFRKRFPSLTALVALEATIRHRSVTAAAEELGVSQAAVSRHIAALEEEFGHQLFSRGHRSLEPTSSCEILGAALQDSFYNIADAVEIMRANASDVVTIGATVGFSSLWLLPRLADFSRKHPGIKIRVISKDSRFTLDVDAVDVVIRYGVPPFSDGRVIASREDLIFPVCSPAFADQHDLTDFPDGHWPLIETDAPSRSWIRWADWLARMGRKSARLDPALRFSYHPETITAAKAGQGIALGRQMLNAADLDAGRLIRVGTLELVPESSYNVVLPHGTKRTTASEAAAKWLTECFLAE